jgi:hypothetical protein
MTEQTWLTCTNPHDMLFYLGDRASGRKLRLFAVAYWRRLSQRWKLDYGRAEVEQAQRYADGLTDERHLAFAHAAAEGMLLRSPSDIFRESGYLVGIAYAATHADPGLGAMEAVVNAPWACEGPTSVSHDLGLLTPLRRVWNSLKEVGAGMRGRGAEHRAQANLLRHIFGNPFHTHTALHLSTTIRQLSEAVYEGEDAVFALRDALIEAACSELADHFEEARHPRGCWALDLLLGKQ